jgi:hypothetical protein
VSKRVVLRLTKWSQDVANVRKFLDEAESLGAEPNAKLHYAVDANGQPCFYIVLPEKAAEAIDRKRTPKAPSKAQAAVQKQIQQHRAKVKSGEKVAHVTPIVRNGEIRKVTVRVKKKKAP